MCVCVCVFVCFPFQQADLYNAMFTALVQDRADFVQLFLDNGVDLKRFLTTRTLWNLYCNVSCLILKLVVMLTDNGFNRCNLSQIWIM